MHFLRSFRYELVHSIAGIREKHNEYVQRITQALQELKKAKASQAGVTLPQSREIYAIVLQGYYSSMIFLMLQAFICYPSGAVVSNSKLHGSTARQIKVQILKHILTTKG